MMSNDLIRRSDVIKFLNDYLDDCYRVSRRKYEKTMLDAISMDFEAVITDIPAVEPKQGEWNPCFTEREQNNIFNCKLCGDTFFVMQGNDDMNYCPNCGARMEDEKALRQEAETIEDMSLKNERHKLSNREWKEFMSRQFDISKTSAKEMLHGMMRWKKEDNFKRIFNQIRERSRA